MALVAYDGSGSSSEEEDEPLIGSNGTSTSSKASENLPKVNSHGVGILPPGKESTTTAAKSSSFFSKFMDIDNEDDVVPVDDGDSNMNDEENPIWSKFLPQPKKAPPVPVSEVEDDVEIGPIPPKKTYGDEELPPKPSSTSIPSLTATKVKGKVRISIPFLNSFEDEPPEETTKRKYVEPSKKGSGLFAILPQPKNSPSLENANKFLKSTNANAETVTRSGGAGSSQAPEPGSSRAAAAPSVNRLIPDAVKNRLKRPASGKLDEIRAKLSKKGPSKSSTVVQKDSDDSDDEEGGFFSFGNTETVDPEALEKLKLPTPDFNKRPEPQQYESMEVEDQQQEYQAHASNSDDLMKFIQPKRGRKEDIKIIDINAADLRADDTEWLKNMTDEAAAPARRSKGLGGMVKRKHQITYLAFEAKAREQELKNQWAQNRANKMATKNKYGF